MFITITKEDFIRNWYLEYFNNETYTNKQIRGMVYYDDEIYVVLKII